MAEDEYLREALRLAELRIEQQQRSGEINQRKAVWLITFCLTTAGYLYASQPDAEVRDFLPVLWKITAIILGIVFAIAVVFSIMVINIANWRVQGAPKSYTLHPYFDKNFNKMAEDLLKQYEVNYRFNNMVLYRRGKYFKSAKYLGFGGIAGSALLILGKETAGALHAITALLI